MVNFVCQLDWAIRCLDIWPNIILGISLRVFWMRLTSSLIDLDKQIALPNVNGPYPIGWKPELNKKADSPWVRENSDHLWIRMSAFYCLHTQSGTLVLSGSWASWLWIRTTPSVPLVLRPFDLDWNYTLALPGLQLANLPCGSWDLSMSIIIWTIHLNTHIYILPVLFP